MFRFFHQLLLKRSSNGSNCAGLSRPSTANSINSTSTSTTTKSRIPAFFRSTSFSSSSAGIPIFHSSTPPSASSAGQEKSAARPRTASTFTPSNLPISPSATTSPRQRTLSAAPLANPARDNQWGQKDVGQSPAPASRPSTPNSAISTTRKKRTKNLSIWSLSPLILSSSSSTNNSPASKFDHTTLATTTRPSSSSAGPRSLSCFNSPSHGPPSPPLDRTLFLPPSSASSSSRPSTPQRPGRQDRDRSESASTLLSVSSSTSSSTGTTSTPPPGGGGGSAKRRPQGLKKRLSSLMLSSPSTFLDSGEKEEVVVHNERKRQIRTNSKATELDTGGGNGRREEEVTDAEIESWRLSNHSQSNRGGGLGLGSRKSMERLGSYDSRLSGTTTLDFSQESYGRSRKRTTSSNQSSLLELKIRGTYDEVKRYSDDDDDEDDDEEGEVLIIDRTKSKGFSTLLGGEYEEFIPKYHHYHHQFSTSSSSSREQTPTVSNFNFPFPLNNDDHLHLPTTTTTTNEFELRNQAQTRSKRLSQVSTNSEEALWLDASTTQNFLPPPPPASSPPPTTQSPREITEDSPKSKVVKQSVFSNSLVHPTPPAAPSTPPIGRVRRASLIPLSPKIAQEHQEKKDSAEEEGKFRDFTVPPSPPESDEEKRRRGARGDDGGVEALGGLLIRNL
ncbi:uncharacterized protein JCM6883_002349 [Sporobolomyces salmoneus]|uniref:uncharacterized protein n=1 Tax=Sporobolomyces salmoneus TaxID=183962 RepID=UPI00317F5B85